MFFFRPWVRERVQIPEGRAYVKNLYQVYDLSTKNESVDLSTCRQISNLLIIPVGTKIDRSTEEQSTDFIFRDTDIKLARWLVVGWILGWRTPDTQCT